MRLPSALRLLLAFAFACGSDSGKSDALDKPFFYTVTKDGKTTYVLGTYHVGVDPNKLPPVVHQRLEAAKIYVSETDTSEAASLGFGQRKNGGTLRDDLGPEYWAKLEKLFDGGVPPGTNQMHPAIPLIMLQFKDMPAHRMDEELKRRARGAMKELVFLEPAAKQIALLEKWFDVRALKGFLDDPDLSGSKTMADIYRSGDEARLMDYFHADMAKMAKKGFTQAEIVQATEEFLYERNRAWIAPLEKVLARGDAFVAVGAAHLLGPDSVLDLLAKRGYTITRVTP